MDFRLRLALRLEQLRRRNLKTLHPLQQLFWESTLRCNVHCLHCGSESKANGCCLSHTWSSFKPSRLMAIERNPAFLSARKRSSVNANPLVTIPHG